jgi:hypothetical protein
MRKDVKALEMQAVSNRGNAKENAEGNATGIKP